jgi:hypothetical protein
MPVRILLAAVVALLLGAGVAHAAAPGRNGEIAFVRDGAVWVAAPDGSAQRLLIPDADSPAWSADGRSLAFVRDDDIWIADADGSEAHQLTTGGGAGSPTWSPDGRRVAYEWGYTTWAINVDGTGAAQISTTIDPYDPSDPAGPSTYDPDWSPDRSLIAVMGQTSNELFPSLTTFAPDGSGWTALYDGTDDPEWSPDGRHLAYTVDGRIYHTSWSEVYVDDEDVSPSDRGVDAGGQFLGYVRSRWPAWSPDGTTLAYQSDLESDDALDIWAYHFADGTTTKLVANATEPDWQPLVATDCDAVRAHPRRLWADRRWHRVRLRGADVQVTGVSPRRGSFTVPGRPVVWLRAVRGRAYVISFAGDGCTGSVTVRVRR